MRALRIFERKLYRRIFGPVKDGGVWRVRHSHETNEVVGREDVVRFIKSLRFEVDWPC